MAKKKKFSLASAILMVICVVFVAEAAPIVASMGNSQYVWWLILIVLFLVPYGLISSELSTAFPDEGGLYDWVKTAFGKKWGTRVSWYYWVNFPIWMGSLAVLFPLVINFLIDPSGADSLGMAPSIAIALAFVWMVVGISLFKVSDSAWVMNAGAAIKVGLALLLLVLGLVTFVNNGFVGATDFTWESFAPFSELTLPGIVLGLGALTIILFNFMGFEVMSSVSSEMEDPQKQLPIAIVAGGIAIAAVYIISSFGIGVAIPADEVAADLGIVDAVNYMAGADVFWLVVVAGVLFLITLFGNMVSWSYGVNYVAAYGAKNGDMPRPFAKMRKGNEDMPLGAPVINGIVASVIVVIGVALPYISAEADAMFWAFFSLSIITLLMSYVPMFPAWLKLRRSHPEVARPYKVPGGKVLNRLFAFVPVVILVVTIVLSLFPAPVNALTDEDVQAYAQAAVEEGVTEDEAYVLAALKEVPAEGQDAFVEAIVANGMGEADALLLASELAPANGELYWASTSFGETAPTLIGVILAVVGGEAMVALLARRQKGDPQAKAGQGISADTQQPEGAVAAQEGEQGL
ncbi:MAG: APC family permease [Coriobacteriaceae bacterium]|jgi:amino acid transporter|nr:APC family permease [Coriobacteriaceae bacterium]